MRGRALWPARGSAEPRLRRRRVVGAVWRGLESTPALGMRQLSVLGCALFKKKPKTKPPLDVLVLRGCSAGVFAVALPGVSKKHADSCMIGGVGWFFFFPLMCLNCDLNMEGQIWFLPRSLQLSSFQAYKLRVTHLYQLKQHSILVSVGEDEEGINPLVS